VPLKWRLPFWPGTVVVTPTPGPPGVIVSEASGGTLWSVSVTLPVAAPCGSTRITYVPVTASVRVSMNPPPVPNVVGPASRLPSGFRIENCARQQLGPACRLTRCPAVPENEIRAFCPEVSVVTVSGAPPGTIAPVTSTGTSSRDSVMLPVFAPSGSSRIV
jgi:hypothetical protein